MKANQSDFRTILRTAVPMVVGLALPCYATASFALGSAEQRVACTPDVFRLCSSDIPAGSSGSRVALVIGNASYPNADPKLTQPIGNARALADELTRDGFQVEEGENLSKEAMQCAFDRLYDKIKPGTIALIFFSGFGIQSNRQSYLIPVDGQIYKEDDVRHDGIRVDNVLSEMNKRGASVKIVILDASRRNRFEGNFRVAPLGLALPANPPSGTLVMYSAGSGSMVRDAANDRGLFVSELLEGMRAPGMPAEEVFNRTRVGVLRATLGEQNPYSSLNEDFTFDPQVSEGKPYVKPKTPTTPSDSAAEAPAAPAPAPASEPVAPAVAAASIPKGEYGNEQDERAPVQGRFVAGQHLFYARHRFPPELRTRWRWRDFWRYR